MKTPDLPSNEASRLAALQATHLLDTPPEERFDRVTRLAAKLFDVPICLVSLIDSDRQWFKSCLGLDVRETGRDISFCGHAILGSNLFVVEDALTDERFSDNPLVTGPPDIRFYAGAPLTDLEGYRLGTLCLIDRSPRTFSEQDQLALRDFADIIEREFRYQELNSYYTDRTRALNILNDIALDTSGKIDHRIERALAIACQYLNIDTAIVSKIEGEAYTILWHHERQTPSLQNGLTLPLAQTYCAILMNQPDVLAIDHMATSPYLDLPCYQMFGLESYLAAPIWVNGNAVGTLNFSSTEPRLPGFTETEKTFVSLLARWIADLIQQQDQAATLDKLVSNAPGMLYQYRLWPDNHSSFPYTSEGIQNIFSLTADDVFEDAAAAFERIHPDDLPLVTESIKQSAENLEPWEAQYRVLSPEGHWRWIEGKANPEKLPEGSVLWHGYLVDIDERRKNEEMKNQFVSTVSHELRTPLTSIAGSLGLILGGVTGDISEKTRQMLNITRRNADQLRALIDDLLDIEKLVSGNMLMVMEQHPIADVVSTSIEHLQSYANQKDVQLHLKETSAGLEANIDPQRLQQAVANLLSNAVKFSPPRENVTIKVRQMGDQAIIEVTDKGTGVPESFRDRIFEKFAQADASSARAKEGTGLGLAITKQLMQAMGGDAGYESEEGAGATFWLSMPIQGPADNE
ncbi:Alkaline phosphatase synthesis sensor protein PhoR [Marinobacter litoralis]|uniref:histidine kinase n=1 Tax=Marinobacter litoralis TaxID=187981 RepID=A0A3M2RCT0_9GAMM|nr:GAF domain-containing protein [Marinobacter litoralis]RMJ03113.1 Alkaline phosphatase synthesis sensor protein PhoR [Marinobacter litoralis]